MRTNPVQKIPHKCSGGFQYLYQLLMWGPNDLPLYRCDDRLLRVGQLTRVVEAIRSRLGLRHEDRIVGHDLGVPVGLLYIGGCGLNLYRMNSLLQRRSLVPDFGFGICWVEAT